MSMKAEAINHCTNLQFTGMDNETACPGTAYAGNASHCMRNIMSACALAYITDPANKQTYLDKVVEVFPKWEDILIVQSGAQTGTRNTSNNYYNIAGAAYFNTLLAVDIMYDDLANMSWESELDYPDEYASQLDYFHFVLEQEFNHFYGISKGVYDFYNRNGNYLTYHMPSRHPPAKEAILSIWKIYNRTLTADDPDSQVLMNGGQINPADGPNTVGGFIPETSSRVNSSGVYSEGAGYALAGWGSNRMRSHLIDVLEFTGLDNEFGIDFCTDPRWQNFFQWLYGYASSSFGMNATFGDTYAYRGMEEEAGFEAVFGKSSRIASPVNLGQRQALYAL